MNDESLALPPWLEPTLERMLGSRAHAVLIHADGAAGQLALAWAAARAWLCESPKEHRACGACAACHLFDQRLHPDLRLLIPDALREQLGWSEVEEGAEGKSKAKPSREIKVDAVRAAIDWAHRTSSRGGAKVLVIHPAEAMNEVTANALLKTLEEPPGALRLVLTAHDPEALLPTVRSRCQRIALARPTVDEAATWLDAQGVTDGRALLAAAGGLPQAALALHRDGIDASAWALLPTWASRGQATPVTSWPVARLVDALHKLCHDLMRAAAGGTPLYFGPEALAAALRPAPPQMSALIDWERELRRAARHDEHPWHAALRNEALMARAAAVWQTAAPWQTARPAGPAKSRALDTLPRR